MIDANLLRENPEAIKASQRARGASEDLVDQAAAADDNWRKAQAEFENLRAEQNATAKLVAGASSDERTKLIAQGQKLAAGVKAAEQKAADFQNELNAIVSKIENVVTDGVPVGGEDNFVVIREEGTKPNFSFTPIQDFIPSLQSGENGTSRYISLANGEGTNNNYDK
jgi:seryl-tRNA synthetase